MHFGASAGYQATDSSAWGAHGSAGLAYGCTGNMASSTSNDFFITGVQLEVGTYTSSTIPPFQHESYADNYLRCSRYYQVWNASTPGGGTGGDPSYNCIGEWNGSANL